MSKDEWQEAAKSWRDMEAKRAAEEKAAQDRARVKVNQFFNAFPRAEEGSSLYLISKGVPTPHGPLYVSTDELTQGWLALPLQDANGTIHSAQFIGDDGTKRFQWQGKVQGCYYPLNETPGGPILICEGYATGATLYEATRWTVICAMNAGNLGPVTKEIRKLYPTRRLVICADNDQFTEGNPGVEKAQAAAKAAGNALVAIPEFGDEALINRPTDFNDLHQSAGLDEVARQVYSAFPTYQFLEQRRFDPRDRPSELHVIYTLADTPISTPGNLTSINSLIKTGKSAVIGAMCSSVMTNGHSEHVDNLGFKSSNPKGLALVHFDTEQSPDDHWYQVDRMLRRARLTEPFPWFYSYCLTGLDCKTCWKCVKEALMFCADRHGGIHSVLIDGAADLVSDVNDAAETNAFVA
jgi:hypothetical protein